MSQTEIGFSKGIRKSALIAAAKLKERGTQFEQVGSSGFYIVKDPNDGRFVITLTLTAENGEDIYLAFAA